MGAAKDLVSFCLAGRLAGPPPLPVPWSAVRIQVHPRVNGSCALRCTGGSFDQEAWRTKATALGHSSRFTDMLLHCKAPRDFLELDDGETATTSLHQKGSRVQRVSVRPAWNLGVWSGPSMLPSSTPPTPVLQVATPQLSPPPMLPPSRPPTARLRPLHAEVGRKKKNSSSTPHCGDRHLHTQKHHDTEIIPATRRNASSASRTPATVRARDRQSIEQPSDIPCRASAASPNPTRGQSSPELPHFPWLCDHGGGLGAPILHQTSSAASTSIEEDSQSSSRVLARNGEPSVVPGARRPE